MINLIFFFGLVVGVIIFGLTLNVIWNRSKEGAYGLMAMHLSLMFLFSYYSLEETEGAVVFVIQPIIIAGLLYSIRLMERHEKIQCSGVWQAEADADVARYKAHVFYGKWLEQPAMAPAKFQTLLRTAQH